MSMWLPEPDLDPDTDDDRRRDFFPEPTSSAEVLPVDHWRLWPPEASFEAEFSLETCDLRGPYVSALVVTSSGLRSSS